MTLVPNQQYMELAKILVQNGGIIGALGALIPALVVGLTSFYHKPTWDVEYDREKLERVSVYSLIAGGALSLVFNFMSGGNLVATILISSMLTVFFISVHTDMAYHRVDRYVAWSALFFIALVALGVLVATNNPFKWIIAVSVIASSIVFFIKPVGLADARAVLTVVLSVSTMSVASLAFLNENAPLWLVIQYVIVAEFIIMLFYRLKENKWRLKGLLDSRKSVPLVPWIMLNGLIPIMYYVVMKTVF